MYARVYHLSFFSTFLRFFNHFFLGGGNCFKIEQWQRESTWRFACSQETLEPTREYISRTVKIGCISFMKIFVMYSWRNPMDIPCASSSQIWSPLLLHLLPSFDIPTNLHFSWKWKCMCRPKILRKWMNICHIL